MFLRRMGIAVSVIGMTATGTGLYAAPLPISSVPVRAMFGTGKMVNFSVRNDSKSELKLQCGEQMITVAPGQTSKLKVPSGSKVMLAEAFGDRAAGTLLTTADPILNGTTLGVR